MAVLKPSTNGKLGLRGAKLLARNPTIARAVPPAARLGLTLGKPMAKRRARQRREDLSKAAQTVRRILATYWPEAARQLQIGEPPRRRRNAPLLAVGVGIGASAVYFLEPGTGKEHRERVLKLIK